MKKSEKIATALVGIGMLGAVICVNSVEHGLGTFIACEAPFFALMIAGARLANKTAEAKASAANTMKGGKNTANS